MAFRGLRVLQLENLAQKRLQFTTRIMFYEQRFLRLHTQILKIKQQD